jgi:hypothetical protein
MKTPYTDTDELYNMERQKILDEVLKKLEKEIKILNSYGYGRKGSGLPTPIIMGLEHAKLIVKDMRK